jgi:peptidoglycan/xylan/chitin deacetylase (PgdA/CDA1 family)
MAGTLLIGYDVEGMIPAVRARWGHHYTDPDGVTREFLSIADEVHSRHEAPCTFFILGEILEKNVEAFQKAARNELFDLQQHTYTHVRLKTVVEQINGEVKVWPGGSAQEIIDDVARASAAMQKHLGVQTDGLCGPFGYYRGLSDRPDLLQILREAGFRFLRTYMRNQHDWGPVPAQVQPFWYEPQGFADMLEITAQGWQDCHYRQINGWQDTEGYLNHLLQSLDHVAENDLTWSLCVHDFSTIREDPQLTIISRLLKNAKRKDVRILSCRQFYEHMQGG